MSDDFKAKLAAVKSNEDFKKLLDDEKIQLNPEQVEALAGGGSGCWGVEKEGCSSHCGWDVFNGCDRYAWKCL